MSLFESQFGGQTQGMSDSIDVQKHIMDVLQAAEAPTLGKDFQSCPFS